MPITLNEPESISEWVAALLEVKEGQPDGKIIHTAYIPLALYEIIKAVADNNRSLRLHPVKLITSRFLQPNIIVTVAGPEDNITIVKLESEEE